MSYGKPTTLSRSLKLPSLRKTTFITPKTSQESLNQLRTAQQQISDVKNSLGTLLTSLEENSSLITKAANFWGKRPLWQKIVIGLVIFGTLMSVGLSVHLMILAVIGGIGGLTYLGASLLLDNHYNEHTRVKDNLKSGILALANLFDTMIAALNKIRLQLMQEIAHFKEENKKLTVNIQRLNKEVTHLGEEVQQLSRTQKTLEATEQKLSKLQEEYQRTTDELQEKSMN
ncbi:hypothetical protein Loa_01402 [Legionella oakridgensis ATCC 33761 = DSM 21215]|uniref:Inclusion membrane protein A n=1 Tax=Legionella oakridgensis ATCC 33761 = DSM 21215 TaxID=1268635 RepID=W0BAT2_9GAMM|nr:hypothetical protein [Legionella oakridgensis]AHE66955.1 hypothetical protein Loa_01402 [Legionella oakridgensis ATCC 33761 = DSM 21215]